MNANVPAGLYSKFTVDRTDGRDAPGGDRAKARYFVLDYVHDVYAWIALASYAVSVQTAIPDLCRDLCKELLATAAGVQKVKGNPARLKKLLAEMGDPAPTLERSAIYQIVTEGARTRPPAPGGDDESKPKER